MSTKLDIVNNRLVPNAMEPRAAIGEYDRATGEYTLYTTSQNPHVIRLLMGAFVLHIPEHKLRVVAPDVGGGFGSKIYPLRRGGDRHLGRRQGEEADQVDGRPLRELHLGRAWPRPRDPCRAGARQGRQVPRPPVSTVANMGAYLSTFAPAIPTYLYATLLAGTYTTPAIYCEVKAVFTNTVPVDAYRGAGRPEATYILERIVDTAARELKIDPAELRRRNFVPKDAYPYQTPVALQYDSGDYFTTLDTALKAADYGGFEQRRAGGREARQAARHRHRDLYRGLRHRPLGGGRRARRPGRALRDRRDPRPSHRQRHGLHRHAQPRPGPRDDLRPARRRPARHPDRERRGLARRYQQDPVRHGHLRLALARRRRQRDRQGARQGGQQGQEDRRPSARGGRGRHRVQGRQVHGGRHRQVEGVRRDRARPPTCRTTTRSRRSSPASTRRRSTTRRTSPSPRAPMSPRSRSTATPASSRSSNFSACDDFGRIINPLIVEGQVHGGLVQGIGQALLEGCVYDEGGQLLTGSFMDYCMPRASDVPSFTVSTNTTLCTHNPLGVKGCGEAGAIGAPAAIMNAVADALGAARRRDPRHAGDAAARLAGHPCPRHAPGSGIRELSHVRFPLSQSRQPRRRGQGSRQRRGCEADGGRHDADPDPEAAPGAALRRHRPRQDRRAARHQARRRRPSSSAP